MNTKISAGLIIGAMMFVMAGSASAIPFTDIFKPQNPIDLGKGDADNKGVLTWTHTMPIDFEIPGDIVNSATLTIFVQNFGEGDYSGTVTAAETFSLGNIGRWIQNNNGNDGQKWTTDIGNIFMTWPGGQFDISLSWETPDTLMWVEEKGKKAAHWETVVDNHIRFHSSTFELNYDHKTANHAIPSSTPNPEPATLLLFGLGLIGLAGVTKKQLKK